MRERLHPSHHRQSSARSVASFCCRPRPERAADRDLEHPTLPCTSAARATEPLAVLARVGLTASRLPASRRRQRRRAEPLLPAGALLVPSGSRWPAGALLVPSGSRWPLSVACAPTALLRYRLIGKKGEGTFSEVLKAQGIKNGKCVCQPRSARCGSAATRARPAVPWRPRLRPTRRPARPPAHEVCMRPLLQTWRSNA